MDQLTPIYQHTQVSMQKVVDTFKALLHKFNARRASPESFAHVRVDYNGVHTPLMHLATTLVEGAHTISIRPWDKSLLKAIEKALHHEEVNVSVREDAVYVVLPSMTQDRRMHLIKTVNQEAEIARIAIRQARRQSLAQSAKLKNDYPQEQHYRLSESIQQLTDQNIAEIDLLSQQKIKELMSG